MHKPFFSAAANRISLSTPVLLGGSPWYKTSANRGSDRNLDRSGGEGAGSAGGALVVRDQPIQFHARTCHLQLPDRARKTPDSLRERPWYETIACSYIPHIRARGATGSFICNRYSFTFIHRGRIR